MEFRRPHFDVSAEDGGTLTAVHWSPPFEGTLVVDPDDVVPYYSAVRKFQWLLGEGPNQRRALGATMGSNAMDDSDLCELFMDDSPWEEWSLTHRMEEGELMTFNQRRMLHGRRAFSSEAGIRHFQGCYLNIDEYMSRLRVLEAAHGGTSGHLDLLPAGNGSPI
jgi:gamma-butyrobetaine dioxygenase